MLFTKITKHAVTSSERAHSITWYKQKRRRNRWASKQVSQRVFSPNLCIYDNYFCWAHHKL